MLMATAIRAPGQTKRETLVIHFKTSKDDQTDRIVSALERLFVGKPVGSAAIGKACGMQHAQALKYLHRANDAGCATPILSGPNGIIRGWVPSKVAANESIAEVNAKRAAEAVKQLATKSDLVSANDVASLINVPKKTVARWLTFAKQMGLVRSEYRRGWLPN